MSLKFGLNDKNGSGKKERNENRMKLIIGKRRKEREGKAKECEKEKS